MYKFICVNIVKSRNFTQSYKKLAQANKIHQDVSKPTVQTALEENGEDTQEYNEEEICSRPSVSSLRAPKSPITVKTLKAPPSSPSKLKEPSKFYTGHFIRSDPPTGSISKRYFHLYSINPSTISKRACYSFGSRNVPEEETRDNYRRAMDKLYNMQQERAEFQFKQQEEHPLSAKSLRPPETKGKKKVPGKSGITYPTHTCKHNLTLTRRYRLREGSAERKVRELEENFMKRMKMQQKAFKTITAKTITYPKLVENLKKNRPVAQPEFKNENPPATVVAAETRPDAAEEAIKSHPSLGNASREAKMKLKTKFKQMLLKSARGCTKVDQAKEGAEKPPEEAEEAAVEGLEVAETKEEAPIEAEKTAAVPSTVALPEDYPMKYSKRVWVNDTNINDLNLEEVCIKDSTNRTSSGIVYGQEAAKPNYKKVDEEAQKLSKFVEKFRKLPYKRDAAVKGPPKAPETGTVLEKLKKEQKELIQELEEVNVKLDDQVRTRQSSDKMRKLLTGALWPEPVEGQTETTTNQQEALKGDSGQQNCTVGELRPKIIRNKGRQALGKQPTALLYHTEQKGENCSGSGAEEAPGGKKADLHNVVASSNAKKDKQLDSALNVRMKTGDTITETKCEDLYLLVRAQNRLEGPTQVEELNERAREKEESGLKRRKQDAERQRVEELKNQVQSLPSLKTPNIVPRIDKVNDRLEEKVEIAEKSKKKIQSLTRLVPTDGKRFVLFKRTPGDQSDLDEPSKCHALNQAARKIAEKHQKTISKEKLVAQKDAQECNQKKSLQEEMPLDNSEWAALRAKRILKGPIEVIEVLAPTKFIREQNLLLFAGKKPDKDEAKPKPTVKEQKKAQNKTKTEEEKPKEEELDESKKEIKEEHHGFALYPPFHKEGTGKKAVNNMKGDEELCAVKEPEVAESSNIPKKSIPVEIAPPKLTSAPITQEITYQTETVSKDYKEYLLKQYYDTKTRANNTHNVYLPKERLIIKDVEGQCALEGDLKSDGAVLRPGDEIVFVGNNPKTNLPVNELSSMLPNALENANDTLSVGAQLAVTESKALTYTRNQIGEMMRKINQLEVMLKRQQQSLTEDNKVSGAPAEQQKSAIKIRAPPPKRPEDKDKKDISKDRPKGPNDMILPPKVRSSNSEVPKESKGGNSVVQKKPVFPKRTLPRNQQDLSSTNPSLKSNVQAQQDKLNNISLKTGKPSSEKIQLIPEQSDEHTEKLRKYFAKKFGQNRPDVKAQQESGQCVQAAMSAGRKVVKKPKWKSPTYTKVEEQKPAGKFKLDGSKSTYEGLHLKRSVSQLSAGKKILKTELTRPASCPRASTMRTSALEKRDQAPKPNKTDTKLGAGKTKYSSWTTSNGANQTGVKFIKRAVSDEKGSSVKSNKMTKESSLEADKTVLSEPAQEKSKSYLKELRAEEPDYSISKVVKKLPVKTTRARNFGPVEENEALGEGLRGSKTPLPKVIKAGKAIHSLASISKPKSVIELAAERREARSKQFWTDDKVLRLFEKRRPVDKEMKEPGEQAKTCEADNNLKQIDPIGTLNVILPRPVASTRTAAGSSLSQKARKVKVTGYKSERTFFSGKISRIESDKTISTSSAAKLDDKNFGGKHRQKEPKQKVAIFRIQSDGEVFVIKKADEPLAEVTKAKMGAPRVQPQSSGYMDRVKNAAELQDANAGSIEGLSKAEQKKESGAYLKAKIQTIYDKESSLKIRENKKNSNQFWKSSTRKPLYGDLSAPDFQKLKDQFFEHRPRDTFSKSQSNTTLDTVVPIEKISSLAEKAPTTGGECDLNKKYSRMLKDIEKRLTDKRKLEKMLAPKWPAFVPKNPAWHEESKARCPKPGKFQSRTEADLYSLNAPAQNSRLPANIKDTLYKVNQPPRTENMGSQEANLALKKRIIYNTILKVTEPELTEEARLKRAVNMKNVHPAKKLIADDRLVAEVEGWNHSLARNVKKRKSQIALAGPILVQTPASIMRVKSYATRPTDKANKPAAKEDNEKASSNFSVVKKLISEDNLNCEVESWGLSVLRNIEKRQSEAAAEAKKPELEEPEAPKEPPSSPSPLKVNKRPGAASDSQLNACLCIKDAKVQFKVVDDKRKRKPKKYPLDGEEKFMYVEKSMKSKLEKEALKNKPVSASDVKPKTIPNHVNKVDINQFKKSFAVVSRTEKEKRRRKEELQEMVFKSKKEQNVKQQEQRSKKEKVGEMNNAAAHILRKKNVQEQEEMNRGTRRQHMYQNDTKTVQPSLGKSPWGNKITPIPADDDKKAFHSGINLNWASSRDVLMSKAEFLRLRKAASKSPARIHLPQVDMGKITRHNSDNSMVKKLNRPLNEQTAIGNKTNNQVQELLGEQTKEHLKPLNKPQKEIEKPLNESLKLKSEEHLASRTNVKTSRSLGMEIESYLDGKSVAKPSNAADVKVAKEPTSPQLSADSMHFKITEMTKLIVNNMKLEESVKDTKGMANAKRPGQLVAERAIDRPWKKSGPQEANQNPTNVLAKETAKFPKLASECDNKCGIVFKCVHKQQFDEFNTQTPIATEAPVRSPYESQKAELEKMIDLKRKNKATRRIKSANLKNMILQPESNSHPRNRTDSDGEEAGAKLAKGANFIFKPARDLFAQTLPKVCKLLPPKAPCDQLLLPMQKPHCKGKDLLELHSTLDKPLGDTIKAVPKESPKKAGALGPHRADPLAKYRHLQITYLTVKRPKREDQETFLPTVAKGLAKDPSSIDEELIKYRFQLLKRLNEEFQKQEPPDRLLPANNPRDTCVKFDNEREVKDVKSYLEKETPEMKATRSLSKGKFPKGKAGDFGMFKKGDDKEKPGGKRCYSTDSDAGGQQDKLEEKTGIEVCQSQLEAPKDDPQVDQEGFDIMEAVPHAFECPSPQLEENRQADLYYRYHKWSFTDLNHYLKEQRVKPTQTSEQSSGEKSAEQ